MFNHIVYVYETSFLIHKYLHIDCVFLYLCLHTYVYVPTYVCVRAHTHVYGVYVDVYTPTNTHTCVRCVR